MLDKLLHNKTSATIIFGVSLVVNGLASTKLLGGNTTAEVSNAYFNLFTPANFTFSIWGVIYLLLICYCVRQFFVPKRGQAHKIVQKITPYFAIISLLNMGWIFAWQYRVIWLSVIIIIGMLITLIKIYEITAKEKLSILDWATIKMPFSIYFGWITVATIANITVLLVSLYWSGGGVSDIIWTLIALTVGAVVGGLVALRHRDWGYSMVLVWAYFGIAIRHTGQTGLDGKYMNIVVLIAALLALLCLLTAYLVIRWPVGNKKTLKK